MFTNTKSIYSNINKIPVSCLNTIPNDFFKAECLLYPLGKKKVDCKSY